MTETAFQAATMLAAIAAWTYSLTCAIRIIHRDILRGQDRADRTGQQRVPETGR